jgi:type VI secretion system protein
MSLTLTLVNVDSLENGEKTQLVLDRHGARIGRSQSVDWPLPDPKKFISSTHCEIVYRNGEYLLLDCSTNGTFLNGASERMRDPHRLCDGDEFVIGPYRVRAQLSGADTTAAAPAAKASGWDWDRVPAASAPPAAAPSGWEAPPAPPPLPASPGWNTPAAPSGWDKPAPPPTAPSSHWDQPAAPMQWGVQAGAPAWNEPASPRTDSSPWGEVPVAKQTLADDKPRAAMSGTGAASGNWNPPPVPKPPADVWDRFAAANEIAWTAEPPAAAPTAAPLPNADEAWTALLRAAGLSPQDIKVPPAEAAATAGRLLNRLLAGLILMLEARARAKRELMVEATLFGRQNNNLLKFLREPETAVARLLSPPEPGYLSAEATVDDSFKDLQAHQMATLAAMQGALHDTLARFSPAKIRTRAQPAGFFAKLFPAARDAALWRAYERDFDGVVQGSDEAFMDFFAKAFKKAYQKASLDMSRK